MAITQIPRGPVTAQLNFFKPPADGSVPYNNLGLPRGSPDGRNYGTDSHQVRIEDIRGRESEFNLDRDAFAVVQGVPPSREVDFVDDESIKEKYYPEVEKLLLEQIPGSNRVVFFDHTVRRSSPVADRGPVLQVHIDQTAKSAAMRVHRHQPEIAEELLKGRYRIVNVWRPLNKHPIEASPLAMASSSTLEDKDVVPVEHRYPNGYTGETAGIKYNKDQRWYYLSGMKGDERFLIECFDSDSLKPESRVQGGRVAHTAFEDPRTRPEAEGRESIEVRALVFGP
ncbi:hypothetical protein MCOR25_002304 [Pyricularia grisea]|nr:hypothetical protein MCOR25_002304 [Pyricularia grisea]